MNTEIQCQHCEGHGYHVQPHTIYMGATREMALDAGTPELEGYPVPIGEELEQIQCEHCCGTGSLKR